MEEDGVVFLPPARCRRGEADWFRDVDGGFVGVEGGENFEMGCVVGLEGVLIAVPGDFDDVLGAFAVVYPATLSEADYLIRLVVLVPRFLRNVPGIGCVVVHVGGGIGTGVGGLGMHGLLCTTIRRRG